MIREYPKLTNAAIIVSYYYSIIKTMYDVEPRSKMLSDQ